MADHDKQFWLITKDGDKLYPYKKCQKSTGRYGYALSHPGNPDRRGGGVYVDSLEEVVRRVLTDSWSVRAKSSSSRLDGSYGYKKRTIVDYGITDNLRNSVGLENISDESRRAAENITSKESGGGSNVPEEITESEKYIEGAVDQIKVNRYERDPAVRRACIKRHGYRCSVCDVLLVDMYGEVAKEFIHVHHLKPISSLKKSYEVDPVNDLRPVCPNCHSMIHRKDPPYGVDEIRNIIEKHRS